MRFHTQDLDFWLFLKNQEDWAILDRRPPHGNTPWERGRCCPWHGAHCLLGPAWAPHITLATLLFMFATCPVRHWAYFLENIFTNLRNILFSWLAVSGAVLADASGRTGAQAGEDILSSRAASYLPSTGHRPRKGRKADAPSALALRAQGSSAQHHQGRDLIMGRCTEHVAWTCPCKMNGVPFCAFCVAATIPSYLSRCLRWEGIPRVANSCSLTQAWALLLSPPLQCPWLVWDRVSKGSTGIPGWGLDLLLLIKTVPGFHFGFWFTFYIL